MQIAVFKSNATLDSSKELPTRLLVAPWGTSKTNKGDVIVNETTLSALADNQRLAKFDRVALDFQHSTVPGTEHYKGEPQAVAAFGVPVVVEGEGVYLDQLDWSEQGMAHAAAGHYPDISPAIGRNKKGEVVFLHSAALTRQGEIDGLTLFSADVPEESNLTGFAADDPQITKPEEKDAMFKKLLITILAAAGHQVDEHAEDADLQKATEAFAADLRKVRGKKADTTPESEKKDKVIDTLSATVDRLNERLDKIEGGQADGERARLIDQASREGKVVPLTAEQIKETPITLLSAMIERLPATVPMNERPGRPKEESINTFAAEEKEVFRQLGITEETAKKYAEAD